MMYDGWPGLAALPGSVPPEPGAPSHHNRHMSCMMVCRVVEIVAAFSDAPAWIANWEAVWQVRGAPRAAACRLPACLPVANCMVLYLMKDGCPSLAAFMAGCVQNNLHNHCAEV